LPNRGIRLDRYYGRCHHVLDLHGRLHFRLAEKVACSSRRFLIYIKLFAEFRPCVRGPRAEFAADNCFSIS
jgi:hypothetical protein